MLSMVDLDNYWVEYSIAVTHWIQKIFYEGKQVNSQRVLMA